MNENTAIVLLAISIVLLVVVGVVHSRLTSRLLRRLKSEHAKEWGALTSDASLRADRRDSWRLTSFVLSGNFADLGDAELTELGARLRLVIGVYAALFGLCLWLFVSVMFSAS